MEKRGGIWVAGNVVWLEDLLGCNRSVQPQIGSPDQASFPPIISASKTDPLVYVMRHEVGSWHKGWIDQISLQPVSLQASIGYQLGLGTTPDRDNITPVLKGIYKPVVRADGCIMRCGFWRLMSVKEHALRWDVA